MAQRSLSGFRGGSGRLPASKAARAEELLEIDGIGPVLAETISAWVANPKNLELLSRLRAAVVDPVDDTPAPPADHPFAGKTVVVTGPAGFDVAAGGSVEDQVPRRQGDRQRIEKTDYVVAGADAGAKHATAVRLGVKVLDEEQFLRV